MTAQSLAAIAQAMVAPGKGILAADESFSKPHPAMLEALISGRVVWTVDPDFGYEVVDLDAPENAALLERVPAALLRPRVLFERQGRTDEYRRWVETMHAERRAFLERYSVPAAIIDAVVRA